MALKCGQLVVFEQDNSTVIYKVPYNTIWSFAMVNNNPVIGCDSGDLQMITASPEISMIQIDKMVRESILNVKLDQATNMLVVATQSCIKIYKDNKCVCTIKDISDNVADFLILNKDKMLVSTYDGKLKIHKI